jgi:hypothetical protein
MRCPICAERMVYDALTGTYGCLDCEFILPLTRNTTSARVTRAWGSPVLRANGNRGRVRVNS